LWAQVPESTLFQTPVNIQVVPKYKDVISNPIDLGKIKENLLNGIYDEPWKYLDDVRLMFDNAWLFNKKDTIIYWYCTKVTHNLKIYY
jgi:E1A/CREB-binding protein